MLVTDVRAAMKLTPDTSEAESGSLAGVSPKWSAAAESDSHASTTPDEYVANELPSDEIEVETPAEPPTPALLVPGAWRRGSV